MVFCGPGASTASTEVKPAAARNCRAVCSPQAVPSPAPPSAKETVMQCRTLTPYIHGPKGLPTFSSRLLEALGSTTRYIPSGASAAAALCRTAAGSRWSWIASKEVMRSNLGSARRRVTSLTSKRAFGKAIACASARARAIASAAMSYPTKSERGYSFAMTLIACPVPPQVGDPNACSEPFGKPLDCGHEPLDEQSVVEQPPRGIHELREVRPELGVRYAPAAPEARSDGGQSLGEHGEALAVCGEVAARCPRQTDRMLGRQDEGLGPSVVLDDAACRHGAEPLADVSLVETGAIRNLLAGAHPVCRRLEEAGPVTDVPHQLDLPTGL